MQGKRKSTGTDVLVLHSLIPSPTVQVKLKRLREEGTDVPSDTLLGPAVKVPAVAGYRYNQEETQFTAVTVSEMAALKASIEEQIRTTHVLIYCKTTCPYCIKVSGCSMHAADRY